MNFMKVSLKAENGKLYADEGSFRMELTPQQSETLRNYAGKDAIFGIRPEDLVYTETPDRTNNVPAKVEVIEPLGSEIHLWSARRTTSSSPRCRRGSLSTSVTSRTSTPI